MFEPRRTASHRRVLARPRDEDVGSHDRPNLCGAVALAVCRHGALSLPVRPAHARPDLAPGHHGERLCHDRQRDLPGHDEVLGQALRDQLRARRHHRADHGVRVRDQLVLLLALCRRRVRRAAGDRGPDGLLPGIDLHRPFLPWLGQAQQAAAPRRHLPDRARLEPVGAVDPRRQWLDAEPGRLGVLARDDAHGDAILRRGGPQPGRPGEVRPHRRRRLRYGIDVRARHLLLVHPEGP